MRQKTPRRALMACSVFALFLTMLVPRESFSQSLAELILINMTLSLYTSDEPKGTLSDAKMSGEQLGEEIWSATEFFRLTEEGQPAGACHAPLPANDSRNKGVCVRLDKLVLSDFQEETSTPPRRQPDQDLDPIMSMVIKAIRQSSDVIRESLPGHVSNVTELHQEVAALYKQGKYDEALPKAEQALKLSKKAFKYKAEKEAVALNNLGQLCLAKGYYRQVKFVYNKALETLGEGLQMADKRITALTYENLGHLYRETGAYDQAETHFNHALELKKDHIYVGPDHESVAITLNHLAILYLATGKHYDLADQYLEQALRIQKNQQKPKPTVIATTLNNLALLSLIKGDYTRSESYLQEAKRLEQNTFGSISATTQNHLGLLYHNKGDYANAGTYYQEARDLWQHHLGPEHPNVATALNNLAVLSHDKGDYDRAESLR